MPNNKDNIYYLSAKDIRQRQLERQRKADEVKPIGINWLDRPGIQTALIIDFSVGLPKNFQSRRNRAVVILTNTGFIVGQKIESTDKTYPPPVLSKALQLHRPLLKNSVRDFNKFAQDQMPVPEASLTEALEIEYNRKRAIKFTEEKASILLDGLDFLTGLAVTNKLNLSLEEFQSISDTLGTLKAKLVSYKKQPFPIAD